MNFSLSNIKWCSDLQAARRTSGEDGGFRRFMDLAEAATSGGVFEAKCLASTITNDPEDNGEAEAVLSLLADFFPETKTKVLVEELARLEAEGARDRADSLIATESKFYPQQLVQAWSEVDTKDKAALEAVLGRLSREAVEDGEADVAGSILRLIEGKKGQRDEGEANGDIHDR